MVAFVDFESSFIAIEREGWGEMKGITIMAIKTCRKTKKLSTNF
jgi:hypothetical protein